MGRRSQSVASKYGQLSRSAKVKRKVAVHPPASSVASSTTVESPTPAQVVAPAPRPVTMPRPTRRLGHAAEGLITDYGYVAKDLRQIAFTAVAMFAIIAVLAFVLR